MDYKLLILLILNFNLTFASIFSLPNPFSSSNQSNIEYDYNAYENYWAYLQDNFNWDVNSKINIDHPAVTKQLEDLQKHPFYMQTISERAEPYLYYLSKEIYKRKLPPELILLPIVESAFNPRAYSNRGAAGIWQMMPKTAIHYNVKLNWWYDGRRDVVMSTTAALDYLEKLYSDFNQDWLLTIAAYNSGGYTVRKAIRLNKQLNKPTDFWSLKLPRETRKYIPKLLAFVKIINNPELYNQKLPDLAHKPYLKIIELESQIDLKLAAKLSNLSIDSLNDLNPGYNRFATAPDGPHRLILPIDNAEVFNKNLKKAGPELIAYKKYQIQKGDTLIGIAKKFNTRINIIKQLNNLASNTIRINKNIIIPLRDSSINLA